MAKPILKSDPVDEPEEVAPEAEPGPKLCAVCGDTRPMCPPYADIAMCSMLTEWPGEIPAGHHGMCFRCMDNWVTAGGGWCCPFCKKALKYSGFTRIRERQGIRSDNWADPPPAPRESGPAAENLHEQVSANMAPEERG